LKEICRKNYKTHIRSNNYGVCTAVERCFPNILDVMVIENVFKNCLKIKYGDRHDGVMKLFRYFDNTIVPNPRSNNLDWRKLTKLTQLL
jgi:hypothetical protein